MTRLIEFTLDNTTSVLVEAADDLPATGMERVSERGVVAELASDAFDAALAGIKPIAASVMAQLKDAVADAKEVQVEFGIKLSASAGVVIAKASTEGHCKVAIKWVRG